MVFFIFFSILWLSFRVGFKNRHTYTARRFIVLSGKRRKGDTKYHKDGRYRQNRVESVHYSAVSGQKVAVILYAMLALDKRGYQVAELCDDGENETRDGEDDIIDGNGAVEGIENEAVKKECRGCDDDAADSTLDCLFRADIGD